MVRTPTDDEVYWALVSLSVNAPEEKIRQNSKILADKFTTETDSLLGSSVVSSIFGAPETDKPIPKHRAPVKIEETQEAKAIVKSAKKQIKKKEKAEYNDPVFKCYQDYESCIEGGTSKFACVPLMLICMARAFTPKNIGGINIGNH